MRSARAISMASLKVVIIRIMVGAVTKERRASSALEMFGCSASSASTAYCGLVSPYSARLDPSRQGDLVEALNDSTAALFVSVPGFVSANFHGSLDGTRVINYAQWASETHFQEMMERSDVREHMAEIMAIAEKAEPRMFRVRSIHHALANKA
ncbi:MAG: hypothetical protein DLM55_06085 [Acidimicrobiales bacterium]|nr:MAG: hypothetical protein DLM55_06085 [Acidimicrobiales bacterium]